MSKKFDQVIAEMPHLLRELLQDELRSRDNLCGIPQRGVYVLYDESRPIYVGRSNRLGNRLLEHSRQSSTHNSAPFAFNLAKEEAARRGVDPSQARNQLEKDPVFRDLFTQAKRRVSQMRSRTVGIEDPVRQTLFEVYAALVLETPYNVFDTH